MRIYHAAQINGLTFGLLDYACAPLKKKKAGRPLTPPKIKMERSEGGEWI